MDDKKEFVIDKTLHTAMSPHHAKPIEDLEKLSREDEDELAKDV